MVFQYKLDYNKLSDRQIVEKVLAKPHDEDAAAFLLHDRYAPLLHKVYRYLTQDDTWYDDCVHELFIHLKGKDCSWHNLATLEWRTTFGCWLRGVAKNKFELLLSKWIENRGANVSIDNTDNDKPKLQIPDNGVESYEQRERKVMLLEAIEKLKDEDQKFVIRKRTEGYKSMEIAILLQERWKKYGIKKYNKDNELVVPDAEYVNVHAQRARQMLKIIMSK